jgi:FkbM family methyltransferase
MLMHRLAGLASQQLKPVARAVARMAPEMLIWCVDRRRRDAIAVFGTKDQIEVRQGSRVVRLARHNFSYVIEVANHFDFYFDSARPRAEGSLSVVDMSRERDHWLTGFDDFPIRCPSVTEPWTTAAEYLAIADLKPGERVMDLGAYAGLTSIAFSKAVGSEGRVLAVEPDPANAAAAAINLERHAAHCNRASNVSLIVCAAAAESGHVTLACDGTMGSGLASVIGTSRGSVRKIPARTLAQLGQQLGRVDFIKIDIEGAEVPVIDESLSYLAAQRPRLLIEPHNVEGQMTTGHLEAALSRIHYRCELVAQSGADQPLVYARAA